MSSPYERQVSAAELALRQSEACTPAEASLHVARAQVHATLAVAAATIAARPPIPWTGTTPDDTQPAPSPEPLRIAPLDPMDADAFDRD